MHGAFVLVEGPSPAPSTLRWIVRNKNQGRPIEIGRPDWRKLVEALPLCVLASRAGLNPPEPWPFSDEPIQPVQDDAIRCVRNDSLVRTDAFSESVSW